MEPTNDENASNSDFYSEKMKDTIDELCRQPPIRVACPVCGGLLEDQPETLEIVYAHLLESHAIQIDKITKIAIIEDYLKHIATEISAIGIDSFLQKLPYTMENGVKVHHLGPETAWELEIRETLRLWLLNMLIEAQRIENSEIKLQTCLHCPYSINGTVPEICDHMFEEHGFSVGLPDNLVHLPRLLNILRIKLEHMQCFYCEYIFRTTKLLKEHMRKKKHWRIPQSRPLYDRFYLVTYSNVDMEPYNVEDPEDENEDTAEDEEYQGWDEDERDGPKDMAQCIYCPSSFESPRLCFQHLSSEHKFDFFRFKTSLGLTPYQCIALLNYARKCSKELKCMTCDVNHATSESLLAHMRDENHFHPPIDSPVFTDPSFMIPTFEGDLLLTGVDEDEESADEA